MTGEADKKQNLNKVLQARLGEVVENNIKLTYHLDSENSLKLGEKFRIWFSQVRRWNFETVYSEKLENVEVERCLGT